MGKYQTLATLAAAFLLGIAATMIVSGCQQSSSVDSGPATDDLMPMTNATSRKPAEAAQEAASSSKVAVVAKESAAPDKAVVVANETAAPGEPAVASKERASKEGASKEAAVPIASAPSESPARSTNQAVPPSSEPTATTPAASKGESKHDTQVALAAVDKNANAKLGPGDWTQWGGSSYRNNVPNATNLPTEWATGKIDRRSGEWKKEGSQNVKWVSRLGSQTYGNPVIASGRLFIGTNNTGGYLKRYPADYDLGVLLCFRESDGAFLWQHSSEKLPTGRVHDWPLQGICCAPYAEGNRLWYVTSRGEVTCLDAEGFHDGEDDGPLKNELGRLFDVAQNEDTAKDKLAGIIAALGEGKFPPELKDPFAAAGAALPDGVTVKAVQPGRQWSFAATVNDAPRDFRLNLVGQSPTQRLVAFKVITPADKDEADRIWVLDMMAKLEVSQHNMCSCSITALGDLLFVNTSNGVDEAHVSIPQPDAPSFICLDKNTGEVYWTDKSPGQNILHGQWSSPAVAVLGGVPQVIFGGGDGWLYSFQADKGSGGKPKLLWEFDANPKETKYSVDARSTRNHIIGTPVIYDGLVYVAVGEDPEHGEGDGHLWCVDPTKRGDVSSQLAVSRMEPTKSLPKRRLQAIFPEKGEIAIDNPNSAAVWHFGKYDANGDGKTTFEETMHRTCGSVAIKNDLLYIADFSGLFHCLDAKSGKLYWTFDMLAASWGSPLIVGDKVYIGDEDGDIAIFNLSPKAHQPIFEINMENSVYTTPVVANNVLYIANKTHLFAIGSDKGSK